VAPLAVNRVVQSCVNSSTHSLPRALPSQAGSRTGAPVVGGSLCSPLFALSSASATTSSPYQVINRQPPSFAMLTLLLDAPGYQLQRAPFRDQVMLETRRLSEAIEAGELVARDDQLRLYRRRSVSTIANIPGSRLYSSSPSSRGTAGSGPF
jgi:hypothetical protein